MAQRHCFSFFYIPLVCLAHPFRNCHEARIIWFHLWMCRRPTAGLSHTYFTRSAKPFRRSHPNSNLNRQHATEIFAEFVSRMIVAWSKSTSLRLRARTNHQMEFQLPLGIHQHEVVFFIWWHQRVIGPSELATGQISPSNSLTSVLGLTLGKPCQKLPAAATCPLCRVFLSMDGHMESRRKDGSLQREAYLRLRRLLIPCTPNKQRVFNPIPRT